jgi:hypothetical protein
MLGTRVLVLVLDSFDCHHLHLSLLLLVVDEHMVVSKNSQEQR